MPRASFRSRLGVMALAVAMIVGAVFALVKGAWWVSAFCVLAWLGLEAGAIWRRRRRHRSPHL